MGKAWHYLGLDVLLNICPWFSVFWWPCWQKLFEVSRLNIGDDSPGVYSVVVAHN